MILRHKFNISREIESYAQNVLIYNKSWNFIIVGSIISRIVEDNSKLLNPKYGSTTKIDVNRLSKENYISQQKQTQR